jgi:hypothetical protein
MGLFTTKAQGTLEPIELSAVVIISLGSGAASEQKTRFPLQQRRRRRTRKKN